MQLLFTSSIHFFVSSMLSPVLHEHATSLAWKSAINFPLRGINQPTLLSMSNQTRAPKRNNLWKEYSPVLNAASWYKSQHENKLREQSVWKSSFVSLSHFSFSFQAEWHDEISGLIIKILLQNALSKYRRDNSRKISEWSLHSKLEPLMDQTEPLINDVKPLTPLKLRLKLIKARETLFEFLVSF